VIKKKKIYQYSKEIAEIVRTPLHNRDKGNSAGVEVLFFFSYYYFFFYFGSSVGEFGRLGPLDSGPLVFGGWAEDIWD
jgi:hypothetical protein